MYVCIKIITFSYWHDLILVGWQSVWAVGGVKNAGGRPRADGRHHPGRQVRAPAV